MLPARAQHACSHKSRVRQVATCQYAAKVHEEARLLAEIPTPEAWQGGQEVQVRIKPGGCGALASMHGMQLLLGGGSFQLIRLQPEQLPQLLQMPLLVIMWDAEHTQAIRSVPLQAGKERPCAGCVAQ